MMYAGVIYSINLKKRIKLLEKTILMIHEIKIQLEYLNMPVYEIINEVKSKKYLNELNFINECSKLVISGLDFPTAWENSVINTSLNYKRTEKDILLHLGLNLGVSNAESQIDMLNIHLKHFNDFLEKAKIKNQKYGSLSMLLGALSGSMIFILII